MRIQTIRFSAAFATAFFSCALSAAEIPNWVREFATSAHPAYPPATKAVVLLNEEKVTVDASGKQNTQVRKAIKILTAEGRSEAIGALSYDTRGSKVREAKGYVLHPGGKTREFTRKDFVERNLVQDFQLYSSTKMLILRGADTVDPGSVFAYEYTLDEQRIFSQFWFPFQDDLPSLLSRFQLTVPAGWTADAKAFNGAEPKAAVSGETYTWEARNLKPFEIEPHAPGMWAQLPRIGVAMHAPSLASTPVVTFAEWKDVSAWKSKLTDPQAEVTAAVDAKARELTAGKQPMDAIRALAEFAQKIRYVAISTNVARGGGYVPHSADEVLRSSYGDCKDKSNLLRTMLKATGVESYMISIHSGNPRYTQEDFPSPYQFNHAILAIRVPDSTALPATFTHPVLGRLMLFDPTDTNVPFGFVPDHEQNSLALLLAGDKGGIVRTPSTKPSENHVDRQWSMTLKADGSLTGTLEETATGQEAFDNRALFEGISAERFRKRMEAMLSASIPGAQLTALEPVFDASTNSFRLKLAFEAASYAKIMGGRLWMVRSTPMPFYGTPNVNKASREQPLVLAPASFSEVVEWKFPEKLKIDEVPDPVDIQGSFGNFQTSWKTHGADRIKVERVLTLENQVLPVTGYKQARDFFLRFHGAEAAPIVLAAAQ